MRSGLGPVFVYEWLTTSRRWQMFAGRALFVLFLLGGLLVVWFSYAWHSNREIALRSLARMGEGFFYSIVGTQLAIVLLAAPAATAGAICLDKARGSLIHLLVTDLSDAEIVLGKLAARLIPVVGLIIASLPVLAIGILLGGIEPEALVGGYLVTLAVAVLGCALALTLSVWCRKTYEALFTVYMLWTLVLLAGPIGAFVGLAWKVPAPAWLWTLSPFSVAFAPYTSPGTTDLSEPLLFAGIALAISAGLVLLAMICIRRITVRQAGSERVRKPLAIGFPFLGRWLPKPSLDRNPVLWREWQRRQPSRWVRIIWAVYAILAGFFGVAAMFLANRTPQRELAAIVNGFQVSVGLLLLSIGSSSSLAEERTSGSIQVLLATPLATRTIVWGKWWGSYKWVPVLATWPALIAIVCCSNQKWWGVLLIVGLVLVYGATVTSLGLALATWMSRLSKAMAASIVVYVAVSVGWVFLVFMTANDKWAPGLACGSPFYGAGLLTAEMTEPGGIGPGRFDLWNWSVIWIVAYGAAALSLFCMTLATFDRRLGRICGRSPSFHPLPLDLAPRLREPLISTDRHV